MSAGYLIIAFVCNRYIAYARQYCAPRLRDGAKALLQEHYLKLRQQSAMLDGTPVTVRAATGTIAVDCSRMLVPYPAAANRLYEAVFPGHPVAVRVAVCTSEAVLESAAQARQLESLVRLAEARARCDLSATVTREHAEACADAGTLLSLRVHDGSRSPCLFQGMADVEDQTA